MTDTHPFIRAVVLTGGIETHYCRVGWGPPVLLLDRRLYARPEGSALLTGVAAAFRAFAPLPPAETGLARLPGGFGGWLRAVIDGLGLSAPAMVVAEPFALRALAFAAEDPHRVSRLAVLFRDDGAAAAIVPGGEAAVAGMGPRLLLVRVGLEAETQPGPRHVAPVIRFLLDTAAPDGAP